MKMDPQIQKILETELAKDKPRTSSLPPDKARKLFVKRITPYLLPREAIDEIDNRLIEGANAKIRLRIYRPNIQKPYPVLIHFHGGGGILGDIDLWDSQCRTLANQSQSMVIAVDYHLAPEYKYPAAHQDAETAIEWVFSHAEALEIDNKRIALMGSSFGGNLAASMAVKMRKKKFRLQVLIYPKLDFSKKSRFFEEFTEEYTSTAETADWYSKHLFNEKDDKKDPLISPVFAQNVEGVCPALIVLAEKDFLNDESSMYAEKLRKAHVEVTLLQFQGTIHGFIILAGAIDKGREAISQIAKHIQNAFY